MALTEGGIRSPRWTQPALKGPGDALQVVVQRPPIGSVRIWLKRGADQTPLRLVGQDRPQPDLVCYRCEIPEGTGLGMHSLHLATGGEVLVSPNAVHVAGQTGDSLTLLHTSDWHMLAVGASDTLVDNTALVRALVSRINALQPDLAVCTGDVVSRYGVGKAILSDEQIEWQARRAREIALGLTVPLVLMPGNHDVAFAASRRAWQRQMGWPWDNPLHDHSRDLGTAHLAFLDGFAHYDGANALIARAHTPEQIDWLREDMLRAAGSRWRLLFVHYDYGRQLMPMLGDLGVHMLFYGHSDSGFADELRAQGVLNGHLLGSQAYRLVRIGRDGISSETLSWADLIDAHA